MLFSTLLNYYQPKEPQKLNSNKGTDKDIN